MSLKIHTVEFLCYLFLHFLLPTFQVFIQFARSQQDQLIGGSEDDYTSSSDTESATRYSENVAYSLGPNSVVLTEDEKMCKTLQNLDGDYSWNTYL